MMKNTIENLLENLRVRRFIVSGDTFRKVLETKRINDAENIKSHKSYFKPGAAKLKTLDRSGVFFSVFQQFHKKILVRLVNANSRYTRVLEAGKEKIFMAVCFLAKEGKSFNSSYTVPHRTDARCQTSP